MRTNKKLLTVEWAESVVYDMPVVSANGLHALAVHRSIRFARQHNPNHARYSPTNERKRVAPVFAHML